MRCHFYVKPHFAISMARENGTVRGKLSTNDVKQHMKKSNQNTSSSYNTLARVVCILTGFLIFTTMLSGVIITSSTTYADTTVSSNASVIVNASCTITTGGGEYSETIDPGTSKTITGNGINVSCNDSGGYALYAIGFSGDSYDAPNNNRMLGPNSLYIPTANSGSNSYWAMKATGSSSTSNVPTIDNSYSDFQNIPATYTKISHYNSSTTGTTTNSVTTPTYKINIASTQSAGSYTGKVKYTMVHPNNVETGATTNMQNWNGCSNLAIGSETFLKDIRDNKYYRIARLNDGKCWMTENLNIAGGTALSATDTDVTSDYISSFTSSNNLTKSNNTLVLPASSTTGFDRDNYSYVFNSGNTSTDCSAPGCYSYYSWDAATLGSGRSITTDDTDAPHSICPKGWHLPNTRSGTNSTADFRQLIIALGGSAEIQFYDDNTIPTGATMFEALSNSYLSFLRAGFYRDSVFLYSGIYGLYASSTSFSDTGVRYFAFDSRNVAPSHEDGSWDRRDGFPVRCIVD